MQVGGPHHRYRVRPDRSRGPAVLWRARPGRPRAGDRGQDAQGDPAAAQFLHRRRARLPDAGSALGDAVRRRIAADQSGHIAGIGAGRHPLRPRRAVDRSSSARQPAAHRHPPPAARPGQHRARRRARRRHDCGRRSHHRSRRRRRRAGRPGRLRRTARRAHARAAVAHGEVSSRRARHPGADDAAQADARSGSRSSAPASTTSTTSTSRFRSAC